MRQFSYGPGKCPSSVRLYRSHSAERPSRADSRIVFDAPGGIQNRTPAFSCTSPLIQSARLGTPNPTRPTRFLEPHDPPGHLRRRFRRPTPPEMPLFRPSRTHAGSVYRPLRFLVRLVPSLVSAWKITFMARSKSRLNRNVSIRRFLSRAGSSPWSASVMVSLDALVLRRHADATSRLHYHVASRLAGSLAAVPV